MFKYVFEGVIFEADTLEKLQEMLVAVGFKGNVIEEFQKAADQQEYPQIPYAPTPFG